MKIIIAAGLTLTVLVLLHIPKLKNRKNIILGVYAFGMILFFLTYNIRTLNNNIRFSHPGYQTLYQPEYIETGEFPDAFLDEFIKGKTVYTKDDAYTVSDEIDVNEDHTFDNYDNYWLYYYYHAKNMWSYLELNKAKIIKDKGLNDVILSDDQKTYYEDIGPANDMLRYTFSLTPYKGEWGNAFYYYWFYNTFIGDSRIYLCPEDLKNETELVILWQHTDQHDTESYYISSKKFFDRVIAK